MLWYGDSIGKGEYTHTKSDLFGLFPSFQAFLKLYLNQPCRSVQKKNNSSLAHTCILHSGSRKERQGSSCTMTRIFRHELQNFLLLLYYIMEVLQCPAILVTIQTLTEADPNS
ncbi:Hypothetical predicted protein [Podarcis lilfordi]|uniref:Uncharacterized protein n=1 Tax=Podarcis lilfordi TaxID=74358 RepID=A0AA35L5V6_9SAUR|nr:Hypothetical predicted protein [Podarcis lilfordi]